MLLNFIQVGKMQGKSWQKPSWVHVLFACVRFRQMCCAGNKPQNVNQSLNANTMW